MGLKDEWPTKEYFSEFVTELAAADLSRVVPSTSPPAPLTGTTSASARSLLLVQPAPRVSSSVFVESVGGLLKTQASAVEFVDYSLRISGPALTVPVNITTQGSVSALFSGTGDIDDFAFGQAGMFVQEPGGGYVVYRLIEASVQSAGSATDAFAVDSTFTFKTNTTYLVSLHSYSTAWASVDSFGQASASVAPTFSIELPATEATNYQLRFSPGIGNETAPTPVPETNSSLAMLGLTAVILIRIRRGQRKCTRPRKCPAHETAFQARKS